MRRWWPDLGDTRRTRPRGGRHQRGPVIPLPNTPIGTNSTGSGATTAGGPAAASAAPTCRRQVNSRLALRSWRRATTDTDAPGHKLSSTIRRFSSALQDRRAPRILATGHVPARTKAADRAHHAANGHQHRCHSLPGIRPARDAVVRA
jgi:hypothetical protein